jgi:GNAT superfamily N-acetyltransferase
MSTLRIEVIGRQHRPLVKTFRSGRPSLNEYLRRYALRHFERDLLSRTYVALDVQDEPARLAGYFSLSTVSVERASVEPVPPLASLPRFPIPGVLLARLAVDERVEGQGLGRYLFEEALGLTLTLAADGPVAFRLLVTDALDEQAVGFYEHFGLARLAQRYPCRMVLDLRPLLSRLER